MCDRLATVDMDQKVGGGLLPLSVGSPSNAMLPGPRLTSVDRTKWYLDPSNCLATIRQHYRQTDRQTDRTDNFVA